MYDPLDTIAALATGPSSAGVAILRLSGSRAIAIAGELARLKPEGLVAGEMRLRWLKGADGEYIDRGYVLVFRKPRSFTGEDISELHVHGSPAVIDRLMTEVTALGARPALPGEFTLRAFHNDKLDLVQAEALADLISARSEVARTQALEHLDGRLSRALGALRLPLLDALIACEARLDFSTEEDIDDLDRDALADGLQGVLERMRALAGTARAGRMRLRGVRVALYGAPNAGKSTLFNALLGADRALVHAQPGTTRDLVESPLSLGGMSLVLVDAAGVRSGASEVESAGIELARRAADGADVALWLRDDSAPDSVLPAPKAGVVIHLRTKADLASCDHTFAEEAFGESPAISAHRPADVERVRALIEEAARQLMGGGGRGEQVLLARERHAAALERGAEATERCIGALRDTLPLEMCAADLRDASGALAEITGEIAPQDVLEGIFSRFCVGK